MSRALIVMGFALLLAACQTTAPNCAGWTKPPQLNNAVRMVQEEEPVTRWIVGTDRFGKEQGCWK